MARPNGFSHGRDFQPPPSSMLASHVINGHGRPKLSLDDFAVLLEESFQELSSTNDHGGPDTGKDPAVNLSLIQTVVQIGIEPFVLANENDPFRKRIDEGRVNELRLCLNVIQLAIDRTPQIIFENANTYAADVEHATIIPIYAWILPAILSTVIRADNAETSKSCEDLLQTCIHSEQKCGCGSCGSVVEFLQKMLTAFSRKIKSTTGSEVTAEIIETNSDDSTSDALSLQRQAHCRIKFRRVGDYISAAAFIAQVLLRQQLCTCLFLQVKKQLKLLQVAATNAQAAESDGPWLESLRCRTSGLSLAAQPKAADRGKSVVSQSQDNDRATKRPRLSSEHEEIQTEKFVLDMCTRELTQLLTGRAVVDLDSLAMTTSTYFQQLSVENQLDAIISIGYTACRLGGNSFQSNCSTCDSLSKVRTYMNTEHIERLLDTLETLQPHVERKVILRLAALESYWRVLNHIRKPSLLKLTGSVAGKFTLQSLRSQSRDARLKAAKLLQSFVKDIWEEETTICRENRVAVLEYLHSLWQSGRVALQEGVVCALVHVAQVVGDAELNIILVRLVEYLGHTSVYVTGLVASELLHLAQVIETNMQGMMRPFWRTISIVIVRNLTGKPVMADTLCDLLGMQISGFLQMIEEHALPHLVLTGETELIRRFADSNSTPLTVHEVCVKEKNLPKILAALLAQAYVDPEETIMRKLINVSHDFKEHDLAGWLAFDHSQIAFELLKTIGDAGQGKGSKALQGLQLLAQLAHRKSSGSGPGRRSDLIPSFLESNALAIVTLFTSEYENNLMRTMNVERRRSLVALGEVAKLGKGRISMVIPQICACLRSAIAEPALCDAAFIAWLKMVSILDEDEIFELFGQTFALAVRYWDDMNSDTVHAATSMLFQLFKKHRNTIRNIADTLPLLKSIGQLLELEEELSTMRQSKNESSQILDFIVRIKDETMVVAQLGLAELVDWLRSKTDYLHRSLTGEQPDISIAELIRAIVDCAAKYSADEDVILHAAQCLGSIGKVDSSRLESTRTKHSIVVLSNFALAAEVSAFLSFFMEEVMVPAYLTASSLRSKNFIGWALQEFLKLCEFSLEITSRNRIGGLSGKDRQWLQLPEDTRLVLTPFLTSHFRPPETKATDPIRYPIFKPNVTFEKWLVDLTLDLLSKGTLENVHNMFKVCWKLVHFSPGTAASSFLLPYAALNMLVTGTEIEKENLLAEMLLILKQSYQSADRVLQDTIRQCSETVFQVLDYLSSWLQDKRKWYSNAQSRAERGLRDPAFDAAGPQITTVESLLKAIPPKVITQRSIECKSYARALLHWEEYIHTKASPSDDDYRRLQLIYAEIDEPDGIEGVSSCLHVLDAEAQILEHKKAGRWQAAQNWYEMQLTEAPEDVDVQTSLLHALKESGQHDVLLHHFSGMSNRTSSINPKLFTYAIEAAWSTGQFTKLSEYVNMAHSNDYNAQLGSMMLKAGNDLEHSDPEEFMRDLWLGSANHLSYNNTTSIAACNDILLRMHVAEDLRLIMSTTVDSRNKTLDMLNNRLDILGTDIAAKHYALSVHRALMYIRKEVWSNNDIAASWLKTAKLARKAQVPNQAFDAVLRAASLGDQSVAIEQAKLMWLEGRHRKAINTLESAIESGAFVAHSYLADRDSMLSRTENNQEQNNMTAKAYVLLGKWLDQAGQTQSEVIIATFRKSTEQNRRYERGWYQLGRHYNRILDSERQKPPGKENQQFLTGETSKIVIQNYLRALAVGNKYLFQTLPKLLTLWLELASHPEVEHDQRRGNAKFHDFLSTQRKKVITEANAYVKRYIDQLQVVSLYTILPQVVARICHQNQQIHEILQAMIARVVQSFPQQAMWTLMAVIKSTDKLRAQRGLTIINKVVELQKKVNKGISPTEMRAMITAAQRFTDELLRVADYPIEGKIPRVSLARDLGFNHKIAPSRLVVPAESCLIPNIPTTNDPATIKAFRPFSQDPVTITAFLDEALVLASLQKPRKMTIRGSDGSLYAILAKPKDDLRKDQRLMEFDTMINRFLKRDIEASKRRLYIRTYAVIPLNEECGLIEWVNSLKTMREVLLKLYRERNVTIDYSQLRNTLDDICARSNDKAKDFTERVLPLFPPVLRYWFVETFPEPSAWLQARIRYTRSVAVMSMIGHILGLGDRHGENILFEEDNGGVMHVDFNCLFDKGLTFDKPEMVPFRLTHNMVNAFGTFGVEGPFGRCCEITMMLLRNHEDGLMTILETFLHDPTTDFMTAGKRRKVRDAAGLMPDTAEKMLEGVKGKVRGMLKNESVPLSVGGYVEEQIKQAGSRANLVQMYIGWCAFL